MGIDPSDMNMYRMIQWMKDASRGIRLSWSRDAAPEPSAMGFIARVRDLDGIRRSRYWEDEPCLSSAISMICDYTNFGDECGTTFPSGGRDWPHFEFRLKEISHADLSQAPNPAPQSAISNREIRMTLRPKP